MNTSDARTVLRADAGWDSLLAVLVALASWREFYEALGVPPPDPAAVVQVWAVPLVAFSVVLWRAGGNDRPMAGVARAAAVANSLVLPLAVALVLFVEGFETSGVVLMLAAGVICAIFAVLEARIAQDQADRRMTA